MSIQNYIECDLYRPADSSGKPIKKSDSELQIIINGYTHKWITNCYIDFTENSSALGAKLTIGSHIFGRNNANILSSNIRTVTRVSVSSNFSTYTELIDNATGGAHYYGGEYYVYPRTKSGYINGNMKATFSTSSEAPGSGTFHGYRCSRTYNLGATNRQIWIGVKVQFKNSSGTWVDCSRGSGLSVWKIFTTYAPFYSSITVPTHFYGNALNTFACNIGANLISSFDARAEFSSSYYYYIPHPVRNEWSPYITTGTATNNFYCYPGISVSEENKPTTYRITLTLSVVDPSDSNVVLVVGKRTITGNIEYLVEDDTTQLYETPTWHIVDATGNYANYNVVLANVVDTIGMEFTGRSRYGAPVFIQYCLSKSENFNNLDVNNSYTGTASYSVTNLKNYSRMKAGVRVVSGYNSYVTGTIYPYIDVVDIPVVNYFLPSLPVMAIHRCDQDGTANDLGAYCRIDWAINVCPINNQNSKTLVINHPEGTTTYDNLTSYTQGGSLIVAANTENSYQITFRLSDDLNTITKTMRLSTANVTMDWLYNGQGVAFGKVANKENAVEIAEDWKLLAYDMWINDIDVGALLKKLFSRILTLEQFATQTGQTTQFSVSFYDDTGNTWLNRQWVRSGQDAIDPRELSQSWQRIDTPTKEPTTNTTYSFVGWSKNRNATTNDSTALLNITANRNIYAAFSSATRKYSVLWLNESNLLETDSELNYHGSATYNGDTPTKDGYTFGGWMPSGRYIESNENAMAQFYEDVEIEDSWEEIMQAVDNGTAKSKYHMGNWKTLSTSEGDVPMRILYFNKDTLAGSKATAKITWLSKNYLWNHKIMNPTLQVSSTSTETIADWIRTIVSGAYIYTSNTKHKRSRDYPGTVKLTVRCNGSGTLKIGYRYDNYSNGTLVIKVDGEQVYSGSGDSTTYTYLEYTCTANQTFDIELISHNGSAATFYYTEDDRYVKKVSLSCTGTSNSITLVSQTISTRIKTTANGFVEGTGSIGGWRTSQMRSWLNGDFFNNIDPVVRNRIKSVNKYSISYKSDNSVTEKYSKTQNELTSDKIWIPSLSEIDGKFVDENQGVDFDMIPNPSASSLGFWLRSAAVCNYVVLSNADETHEYNRTLSVPTSFLTSFSTGSGQVSDNSNVALYFGFCT